MSAFSITGGRVIDPKSSRDEVADVLIENGKVVDKLSEVAEPEIIDARGLLVVPGLIDLHVHLREPGREDTETVESGARAAALGGFTTIVCMPNTTPVIDSRAVLDYVLEKAALTPIDVKVVGAVTAGLAGERLADLADMTAAGAVGFSDDGRPVSDSAMMRAALEYSLALERPIISHAEDLDLSGDGVMNEGEMATRLGLAGIPAQAEAVMVARDILLAQMTGARVHITHVSTAAATELIRAAKAKGLPVTADCTPHHLVLTDEALSDYDTNFKMNPPLRSEADRQAVVEGIWDGTFDAIASDHAPHARHEKEVEFESAPFGTIGLQTTLPVILTELVDDDQRLIQAIAALTSGAAAVLGLDRGSIALGAAADVTVIDTKAKVKVDEAFFVSRSTNSAFLGRELRGAATHVIKDGKLIVREGELV